MLGAEDSVTSFDDFFEGLLEGLGPYDFYEEWLEDFAELMYVNCLTNTVYPGEVYFSPNVDAYIVNFISNTEYEVFARSPYLDGSMSKFHSLTFWWRSAKLWTAVAANVQDSASVVPGLYNKWYYKNSLTYADMCQHITYVFGLLLKLPEYPHFTYSINSLTVSYTDAAKNHVIQPFTLDFPSTMDSGMRVLAQRLFGFDWEAVLSISAAATVIQFPMAFLGYPIFWIVFDQESYLINEDPILYDFIEYLICNVVQYGLPISL